MIGTYYACTKYKPQLCPIVNWGCDGHSYASHSCAALFENQGFRQEYNVPTIKLL